MNKSIEKSVSPWIWETKKGNTILSRDGENMLSIDLKKKSKASFKVGKSTFDIRNKGFWNPKSLVERKEKPVAVLTRNFWDKIATLQFTDGSVFEFHVYHHPLLMLVITLKDGTEIASFQLLTHKPSTINFSTKDSTTHNEKHLIVFAIGQFVFHGLKKEYPFAVEVIETNATRKNHTKSKSTKSNKKVLNSKKSDGEVLKKVVEINT